MTTDSLLDLIPNFVYFRNYSPKIRLPVLTNIALFWSSISTEFPIFLY